jgi:CO/xanthine dehydrogenase Mo-binding subunit
MVAVDDGDGPFGAKTVGESGIILAPAAVANTICNATGKRMTSPPMSRDKILGPWHESADQYQGAFYHRSRGSGP